MLLVSVRAAVTAQLLAFLLSLQILFPLSSIEHIVSFLADLFVPHYVCLWGLSATSFALAHFVCNAVMPVNLLVLCGTYADLMTCGLQFISGDASEEELAQRRARAMSDPEIQNIMTDPVMRQVLQDLQEDPRTAQKHMQQPQIRLKLDKLIKAGIVRMG